MFDINIFGSIIGFISLWNSTMINYLSCETRQCTTPRVLNRWAAMPPVSLRLHTQNGDPKHAGPVAVEISGQMADGNELIGCNSRCLSPPYLTPYVQSKSVFVNSF